MNKVNATRMEQLVGENLKIVTIDGKRTLHHSGKLLEVIGRTAKFDFGDVWIPHIVEAKENPLG